MSNVNTYKFGLDANYITAKAKMVVSEKDASTVIDESADPLTHQIGHRVLL